MAPIDYPDKLRSTRADGKLVDTSALDGLYARTVLIQGDQILISQQNAQGLLESVSFLGGVQRSIVRTARTATRTADDDFSAGAELTAGALSVIESFRFPNFADPSFLAIWYPATEDEIDTIRLLGSPINYRESFGKPIAQTIGGVAGFTIVSKNKLPTSRARADVLCYNTSGVKTYLRYAASLQNMEINPPDWVAANFAGASAASSTTGRISWTTEDVAGATSRWDAFAVPDDTEDVNNVQDHFSAAIRDIFDNALFLTLWERQAGTIEINGVDYKVWRGKFPKSTGVQEEDLTLFQYPFL